MINEEPKNRSIYNPTLKDIDTWADKNGDNPEHHILKAGEIKEFTSYIADLLEEKLIDRMLWTSLPANKNKEKRKAELRAIIRV